MKSTKGCLAGLALALSSVPLFGAGLAAGGSDTVFRYHFAGAGIFPTATNYWRLEKILGTTNSIALQKELVKKLAKSTAELFGVGASTPAQAKLLEPLWDDVWRNESVAELRRNGQGTPEFLLMVRLGDERAALWKQNLAAAIPGRPEVEVGRRGGWVTLGLRRSGAAETDWEKRAEAGQAPETFGHDLGWFEAYINWPSVEAMVPNAFGPFKPAQMRLSLSVKGDSVRTEADLKYAEPIAWEGANWVVPAASIRMPISSFSGAHNLSALLKGNDFFRRIGYDPYAGDLFFWGQPLDALGQNKSPFPIVPSFAMARVDDADATLRTMGPKLLRAANEKLAAWNWGELVWWKTNKTLRATLPPGMTPQLTTTNDSGRQYLYGAIFVPLLDEGPVPEGLTAQVKNQTDLVYYAWEVTETRLNQWRLLKNMFPLFAVAGGNELLQTDESFPRKVAEQQWLASLAPLLGETVTEIRRVSATEFVLKRKSHCGLTGFELAYLSHWLTEPGFPFSGRAESLRASAEPVAPLLPSSSRPAQPHPASRRPD